MALKLGGSRTVRTGRSVVNAWISGQVTLWWGGKCYLAVPRDWESIT